MGKQCDNRILSAAPSQPWHAVRTHGALTLLQWGHHVAKYLTTTGCRQEVAQLKLLLARIQGWKPAQLSTAKCCHASRSPNAWHYA